MKAQNLRIENLLLDDSSDDIMVVARIESRQYTNWNNGEHYNITCLKLGTVKDYYIGDFRPIPLTEEWLLKFGFEYHHKVRSRSFYNIGNLFAEVGGDGRTDIYGTLAGELMCFVNHVHQLQNLYFALTNEELNFNL